MIVFENLRRASVRTRNCVLGWRMLTVRRRLAGIMGWRIRMSTVAKPCMREWSAAISNRKWEKHRDSKFLLRVFGAWTLVITATANSQRFIQRRALHLWRIWTRLVAVARKWMCWKHFGAWGLLCVVTSWNRHQRLRNTLGGWNSEVRLLKVSNSVILRKNLQRARSAWIAWRTVVDVGDPDSMHPKYLPHFDFLFHISNQQTAVGGFSGLVSLAFLMVKIVTEM